MSCTRVEKSLHISLFEYEIGRIKISHFNTRIEHGKIDVPCRESFYFITHVSSQADKGVSKSIPQVFTSLCMLKEDVPKEGIEMLIVVRRDANNL